LFRFPKNEEKRNQWLDGLGLDKENLVTTSVVCEVRKTNSFVCKKIREDLTSILHIYVWSPNLCLIRIEHNLKPCPLRQDHFAPDKWEMVRFDLMLNLIQGKQFLSCDVTSEEGSHACKEITIDIFCERLGSMHITEITKCRMLVLNLTSATFEESMIHSN